MPIKQDTILLSPAAKARAQIKRYRACCHLYETFQHDPYIRSKVSQHQIEVMAEGVSLRCPPEYVEVADALIADGKSVLSLLKRDLLSAMLRHLAPRRTAPPPRGAVTKPQPPSSMEQLEQAVKGKHSTVAKARALLTLRRARTEVFKDAAFVSYCVQNLGITDSHVYRLLEFAEQLELLSSLPGVRAPESERQVRVLYKLPKEEWAAAWTAANLGCPSKVSGRQVGLVVDEMLRKKATPNGGTEEASVTVIPTAAEPAVEAPKTSAAPEAAPAPAPQVSAPEEPSKPASLRSETMNTTDWLLREIEAANKLPDRTVDAPPSQYSTEDFDPAKMRQPNYRGKVDSWLDWLICKVGIHDWVTDIGTVVDDSNGKHIALGWKVCRRCSESKLKMILR